MTKIEHINPVQGSAATSKINELVDAINMINASRKELTHTMNPHMFDDLWRAVAIILIICTLLGVFIGAVIF